MVAERPLYVPRKCNASFLLSGVCGGTLRLQCVARFVLRIIFEGGGKPHVGYQLPCLIIREMGLFAFMWLRDQDNALVYAIRLGMGVLEGVIALC